MGKPGRPATYGPAMPHVAQMFGRQIITCPRCNYIWVARSQPRECPSCRMRFRSGAKVENIDDVWRKLITGRLF